MRGQRAIWAARGLGGGHVLREAHWLWQTHCYLIWPAAASELLGSLPVDAPVDVFLSRHFYERSLTALVAQPELAWQTCPYRGGDIVHSSLVERQKLPWWDATLRTSG